MKKILLADDEKDIVEFLEYNLKQEGFECNCCLRWSRDARKNKRES